MWEGRETLRREQLIENGNLLSNSEVSSRSYCVTADQSGTSVPTIRAFRFAHHGLYPACYTISVSCVSNTHIHTHTIRMMHASTRQNYSNISKSTLINIVKANMLGERKEGLSKQHTVLQTFLAFWLDSTNESV